MENTSNIEPVAPPIPDLLVPPKKASKKKPVETDATVPKKKAPNKQPVETDQLVPKKKAPRKAPQKQPVEPDATVPKKKAGNIEIVLDERERDLYEEILKIKTDIPISKRVLTIGDILIKGPEDEILLIVERKSLQDLLASIKDGRYTEQSFRLIHASGLPPHQILYCIEGMMSSVKSPEEKTRVYSAMTSIHYYKGMSVLRTWSVQETAELMVRTAEKIRKESANGKTPFLSKVENPVVSSGEPGEPDGTVGTVGGYTTSTEYSQTLIPSVKSENITPENIGEIMLSQIPAVSVASAKALLAVFGGDFIRFMEALKNNDPLLQQVYFVGGGAASASADGKRRKISGKCLENIRRLLLSGGA